MVVVVSVVVEVDVSGVVIGVVASAGVVASIGVDVSIGVVVVVVVVVSAALASGEGEAAAGAVVSVRCSHAAKSAAPARMQMYFFIVLRM